MRPAEAAKGRPTPKRSEAEKGRYQPIGGSRSRSGSRSGAARTPADKAASRTERTRRYEAQKAGEEWALPAKDRGPVRKLARDYVDSKRRVSEYYMYILIVLVVALFVRSKSLQVYLEPLVVVLIVVILVDSWFIRRGLRRLLAERIPDAPTRGLTTYTVLRAIQIRRLRVPQPRVRPGDKI